MQKQEKQWQQPQLSWRWAMGMQLDSLTMQIILVVSFWGPIVDSWSGWGTCHRKAGDVSFCAHPSDLE